LILRLQCNQCTLGPATVWMNPVFDDVEHHVDDRPHPFMCPGCGDIVTAHVSFLQMCVPQ
jgi:hypothetical protein